MLHYNRNIEKFPYKFACKNCMSKKTMETCVEKYGCHFTQTEEYKKKRIQDNMEKYGVPYLTSLKSVKDKARKTNMEKYGVPHPSMLEENKQKRKETVREKYGYDYVAQVPEFKKKIEEACLHKYGFKSPMQNKEICDKVMKTMMKHGTASYSSQQYHIWELIGGELNFLSHGFFLDILIHDNIDVEYNGSGHNLSVLTGQRTQEEFDRRERYRRACLLHNGYKILELNSKTDELPDDRILKEIINKSIFILKNFAEYRIIVDLDTMDLTTFA